jgi:ATP-dependent helicase HrpB
MAEEQGWTLGEEVGWHVRLERRFTARTRVLLATEGILTARLQHDPLLSEFSTIVLDEFHERSVHADLGLALARQAWLARDDLRLVVMSATLASTRVAAYLDDCPIVDVPGEAHPIDVRYMPGATVAEGVTAALDESGGDVLCFLPGAREIEATRASLVARERDVDVVPLHGGLPADAQDAALRPGAARRVVLATNIAETSLTVPRVRAVVDMGLQKVAIYDAARGLDRLETERITVDAATQRAGRAGRLGPGLAMRVWDAQDRLRPYREPEIRRVDLAPLLLSVLAWGSFEEVQWLEPPDASRVATARALLRRLEIVDDEDRLTTTGQAVQRLPLHPRLGRLLVDASYARPARLAVAALSELRELRGDGLTTSCDLWTLVGDAARRLPAHVARLADAFVSGDRAAAPALTEEAFRKAVLAAYPDRVARRRDVTGPRVRMASGTGAALTPNSGVRAEWLVAITAQTGSGFDARIAMATGIEKAWLTPTRRETEVFVDDAGVLRAVRRDLYDALVLHEEAIVPPAETAAATLATAWLSRPRPAAANRLVARLQFADLPVDPLSLATRAASGCRRLDEIRLESGLTWQEQQTLERLAPDRLSLPSGRTARLDYRDHGDIVAAVKLQELFGLADSPRLGPRQQPVLFELLAPNGRPVQTTRDLRSFWTTTYQDVRKELRARYPKHPWPEDPWTATATHRTKGRG